MGQIALGMTTNTNKMFFRTKYRDSWYAWNEVATTDTALLRYSRNNVNIKNLYDNDFFVVGPNLEELYKLGENN